ncbi:hypothetical protein BU14_0060s0004 [Porphyra umbilicalis]|uniref:TrmE-type G domain-containing protein n=1 Tax=Porphyra umbilicalis TaxID=2786 RepID=A0A1X6PGQ4_PORUM|nr:hypothetical protein BU14_0060s0004 [Porphyra umbilicalis]|eukprot:OSX80037.1 hypothetical protein BU14_0060s0004 [Porphyra umbilicalis]
MRHRRRATARLRRRRRRLPTRRRHPPPLPPPTPPPADLLDRPLVLWFPAPASFTGEDVVELHVHGSAAVTAAVTAALAALPATRPAGRGEFTRRALAGGRLDLTEVEGLADLLAADTPTQRRAALAQLGGTLRRLYARWRGELTALSATAEAVLDFGEEGGLADAALYAGLVPRVAALRAEMVGHLADGRVGERVRGGVGVAVLGAPNAGKSTLVNALARRPAAIVSGEAGTTRDVVAVPLEVGGVSVTVRDTAGVRRDGGEGGSAVVGGVEREGIRRARAAAAAADVVVFVLDAAVAAGKGGDPDADAAWAALADVAAEGGGTPPPHVLLVANKADLLDGPAAAAAVVDAALTRFAALSPAPAAAVAVSLTAGGGGATALLRFLEGAVRFLAGQPPAGGEGWGDVDAAAASTTTASWVGGGGGWGAPAPATTSGGGGGMREAAVITRARHRRHVTAAVAALDAFLAGRSRRPTAASAAADDAVAAESVAADEADCAYGLPMDVAAEELRTASRAVAEITGAVPVEAVLDVVFREFCIGK